MTAQTKQLRFLQSILTGKERKWLRSSNHEKALQFHRLAFMLLGFPGDEKIEEMMAWSLLGIISNKLAYGETS
jgi:hypothetical protein